jgi:hypothetical protein
MGSAFPVLRSASDSRRKAGVVPVLSGVLSGRRYARRPRRGIRGTAFEAMRTAVVEIASLFAEALSAKNADMAPLILQSPDDATGSVFVWQQGVRFLY